MNNSVIRRLNENDAEQFADLVKNIYEHLPNLEWFTPMPFDEETMKLIITKPRYYILGMFYDNKLVGVSSFDYKCGKLLGKIKFPDECVLSEIVEIGFSLVRFENRGNGILQILINKLIAFAYSQGFKWIFSKVHEDNISSSKSFIKNGFKEYCDYKKSVNKNDFQSLAEQAFFCKEGKKNACKTLEKFKDFDEIIVNYVILLKSLQ